MKPPFAYYGGKVGLASRIVELMPAHRVYIEPFFGCGAVFFAKRKTPDRADRWNNFSGYVHDDG